MFKKVLRNLREKFLPSQDDQPRKVNTGLTPKAHPLEEVVNPEAYTGHGSISARYRYMTLGPTRKERAEMRAEIRKFRRFGMPKKVDPQRYHLHIKYLKWILENAPRNTPAKGKWSTMDGKKVYVSYTSNNPLYGGAI